MSSIFKGLNEAVDIKAMQAEYQQRKQDIEANKEAYSEQYGIPLDTPNFVEHIMTAQNNEEQKNKQAERDSIAKAAAADSIASDKTNVEDLKQELQDLKSKFDSNFEFSDDHSYWKEQKSIQSRIQGLEKRIKNAEGLDESGMSRKIDIDPSSVAPIHTPTSAPVSTPAAPATTAPAALSAKQKTVTAYTKLKGLVDQLDKRSKQRVIAALKKDLQLAETKEAEYGPEYQAMVKRVGQMAKEGPRKTVWDPVKRVYKTVPVNPPNKEGVAEGSIGTYILNVMDEATGEHWAIEIQATRPEMAQERARQQGYKVLRIKEKGVAEGTSPFGNKVAGPFASEERARREASRISKELGVKRYVEKTSDGKYIVVKKQGVAEDWQKVNKSDKTDGMSKKAVKAYRRENPGSKLKTAVTTKPSKLKPGSKDAKRRKSFCARMSGMKKAHASAKTKRDPDSPINKALRRWNCESVEQMQELIMIAEAKIAEAKNAKQQAAIAIAKKKAIKESTDICKVCGQTPCNCTHVSSIMKGVSK